MLPVCLWMKCDSENRTVTGGRVGGMVVKIVPSRPIRWFDATMPSTALLLAGSPGSRSGGDIIPWMLVWSDRYCSRRNWSLVVLPYHVGRYQLGRARSRARANSRNMDGLK